MRLANVEIAEDENLQILDPILTVGKGQLISIMFGHFDQNHDGQLNYQELQRVCDTI